MSTYTPETLQECLGRIHRICAKVLDPAQAKNYQGTTPRDLAEIIDAEAAPYASPLALASDVDLLQELSRRGYVSPGRLTEAEVEAAVEAGFQSAQGDPTALYRSRAGGA